MAGSSSVAESVREALEEALGGKNLAQLGEVVADLARESTPLLTSRAQLQGLATTLSKLEDHRFVKSAARLFIDALQARAASFEEQLLTVRETLAQVHENDQEWSLAAHCLSAINLESGVRRVDDSYKTKTCIQIAMLFLQGDDPVSAETFINRASLLIDPEQTEAGLMLQHKVCYARILDSKRKFLEAATRYYQLAHTATKLADGTLVAEADLVYSLQMAATCAILAPAGPARTRLLGTLMKDERSSKLSNYAVLEKMLTGRLLRREEVQAFASTLAAHQMATLEDGSTVLDRAVVEHNMLALSRLYRNISWDQLGNLLGIEANQAEAIAARMLVEDRLRGSIDQVEGMLHFEEESDASSLVAFDDKIRCLCGLVERCADQILKRHPELGGEA